MSIFSAPPSLRRADEFAREHGIFDERRTASAFFHRAVGTAHIDIHPVESELRDKRGGFFHALRRRREYLRHDGPLRFGVQKFLAQFLLAFRIRKDKTVGRGEFGEHHVVLTVRGDEPPERRIRHVLKRRKGEKWVGQCFPEILHEMARIHYRFSPRKRSEEHTSE